MPELAPSHKKILSLTHAWLHWFSWEQETDPKGRCRIFTLRGIDSMAVDGYGIAGTGTRSFHNQCLTMTRCRVDGGDLDSLDQDEDGPSLVLRRSRYLTIVSPNFLYLSCVI